MLIHLSTEVVGLEDPGHQDQYRVRVEADGVVREAYVERAVYDAAEAGAERFALIAAAFAPESEPKGKAKG